MCQREHHLPRCQTLSQQHSPEQGNSTHNQPQDLTGKWQCLLPSHTENSVGFHSRNRNYLGAHKTVGLLPGREIMPEGNGRGDMEGTSLGMEQMPHVADREDLTPFSTLFWREGYKDKEEKIFTLRLQNFYEKNIILPLFRNRKETTNLMLVNMKDSVVLLEKPSW